MCCSGVYKGLLDTNEVVFPPVLPYEDSVATAKMTTAVTMPTATRSYTNQQKMRLRREQREKRIRQQNKTSQQHNTTTPNSCQTKEPKNSYLRRCLVSCSNCLTMVVVPNWSLDEDACFPLTLLQQFNSADTKVNNNCNRKKAATGQNGCMFPGELLWQGTSLGSRVVHLKYMMFPGQRSRWRLEEQYAEDTEDNKMNACT